jgi:hypothetical protein
MIAQPEEKYYHQGNLPTTACIRNFEEHLPRSRFAGMTKPAFGFEM